MPTAPTPGPQPQAPGGGQVGLTAPPPPPPEDPEPIVVTAGGTATPPTETAPTEPPAAVRPGFDRYLDRNHWTDDVAAIRSLDVAAMDAVAVLQFGIHAGRASEALPARLHRHHREAHAQLARDDAHDLLVAAMRIHHDQLAQAGPRDGDAELGPGIDQRGGRQRQRPGGMKVLVGLADRLHRQDADVEIIRQPRNDSVKHAVHDGGVGRDG